MPTRRAFVGTAAAATLTGLAGCAVPAPPAPSPPPPVEPPVARALPMPEIYGAVTGEPFPIPSVPPGIVPPRFWRERVVDPTGEAPGTVVVDPSTFYLHLVEEGSTAMRYGIGVGRQGFGWSGEAQIRFKRRWPTWTPPEEMIARDPSLEPYSAENGGQPPGLDNPLGARALYLFQGDVDTLYRIHGTNEPRSIGNAVSSGCVRMLNQDVIDLYDRVRTGAPVLVRPAAPPVTVEA